MTRTTRHLHAFDLRSVLLFTSLSLVGASAALAQTPATAPAPQHSSQPVAQLSAQAQALTPAAVFLRTDKNGDGKISREEAQNLPSVAEQFDAWDRNGDGSLSQEEFLLGAKRYE